MQAFKPFHAINNKVAAIAGTSTWLAGLAGSFPPLAKNFIQLETSQLLDPQHMACSISFRRLLSTKAQAMILLLNTSRWAWAALAYIYWTAQNQAFSQAVHLAFLTELRFDRFGSIVLAAESHYMMLSAKKFYAASALRALDAVCFASCDALKSSESSVSSMCVVALFWSLEESGPLHLLHHTCFASGLLALAIIDRVCTIIKRTITFQLCFLGLSIWQSASRVCCSFKSAPL